MAEPIMLLALTGTAGWQTVAAFAVPLWLLAAGAPVCGGGRSCAQVLGVTVYLTRQGPCHTRVLPKRWSNCGLVD